MLQARIGDDTYSLDRFYGPDQLYVSKRKPYYLKRVVGTKITLTKEPV